MSTHHPSIDEFRKNAHAAVDLIADYWTSLLNEPSPPVLCPLKPGDVLESLPRHPPEQGEPLEAALADVARIVLPGLTHWQHPSFFAFFPSNHSPAAVVGDLLSTGLGVQGMLWATSPACTEVEVRVTDWMARAIGLPAAFLAEPDDDGAAGSPARARGGGVIQGTASESTLVAMLAARHRARRARPEASPVVYCSDQAHSSVVKAAMIAGIAGPDGTPRVRQIATRADWSIDPAALAAAVRDDLARGLHPAMVVATLGTTGVMAFDDLHAVADAVACAPSPVWLHADAAMGGAAFVCPELRRPLAGAERLDSICFNPHKWLLTSFDCGLFWMRDREALTGALSVTPEYLRNAASASGAVTDYRDWQVPLGRRFRSLKLWLVMRRFGLQGLREHVRGHLELAAWLEQEARADSRFELAAPRAACSPLVCLRLRGDRSSPDRALALNNRSRELLDRVNASGRAYLTHTTLPDPERPANPPTHILRIAIGGTFTGREHVERVWDLLHADR